MKFQKGDRVIEIEWPFEKGVVEDARADADTFASGEFYAVRFDNGDTMVTGGVDLKKVEVTTSPEPESH